MMKAHCDRRLAFVIACLVSAGITTISTLRSNFFTRRNIFHRDFSGNDTKKILLDRPPQANWSHDPEPNPDPDSHMHAYAPLDTDFLAGSFDKLKEIVKPLSRIYEKRVTELMIHRLPVINTTDWHLHRTDGTTLSIQAMQRLIKDPDYLVPNVAHYILPFANPELQFHHLVCILSGFWVMRADRVFLWYAQLPRGSNWDLLRRNLTLSGLWDTRVVMARRPVPKMIYRQPVLGREHQSDVMRMEALLVFGGAYFDLDVIALKSLAPLRNRSFTIGRELPQNLCNGVFLSAPNSSLLAIWHVAYQTIDDSGWGEHSLMLPNQLCKAFPAHCHVEQDSLDRPNFLHSEIVLIYGPKRGWDWRAKNYAMHLWYRSHKKQYNMETIKYVDSMLGDMFRFVLYGNSSVW